MLGTPETIERVHPLYNLQSKRWQKIRDLCEAENIQRFIQNTVAGELSGTDTSKSDGISAGKGSGSSGTNYGSDGYRIGMGHVETINQRFRERAVYNNVVGTTGRTLVGLAFGAEPAIELDASLAEIDENADGDGTSLMQFGQDCLRETLRAGRMGVLVDYPETDEMVSVADEKNHFPVMILFTALQIRDWDTMRIGAKTVTSRLVLSQSERKTTAESDKMCMKLIELWLAASDESSGELATHIRHWEKNDDEEWVAGPVMIPRGANGKLLDRLPWVWCGSEANTHRVDFSPLRDIAELNAAHYNNSAIYEDSVYYCGQVQPWMSGMDDLTARELRRSGFTLGSGVLLPVPEGGSFGISQAMPNSTAKEAMDSKLEQMLQMGARLMTPAGVARTATEVGEEKTRSHSVLSWCAHNVSDCLTKALEIAAIFSGGGGSSMFDIDTGFMLADADPQLLQQLWAGVVAGKMTDEDLHRYLARCGLANPDIEVWRDNLPEPEPELPPMIEGEFGEDGEGDDDDDDPPDGGPDDED